MDSQIAFAATSGRLRSPPLAGGTALDHPLRPTLRHLLLLVAACGILALAGCATRSTPNRPPSITSSPVTTATTGLGYSYRVEATDPDAGDALTYSLTTSPSGMTIDAASGVIAWSPASAGTVDVAVQVTDTKGSTATQTFSIAVVRANQAPQVSGGTNQTITLPAQAALHGAATDDGLPAGGALAIVWTKQSGPGSVAFGNLSAADTTATFSEPGSYVVRLTANDGELTTSADVTVTVKPPSVAPPLDPTVPSTMDLATEFLYTGPNPIQTGVAQGTIDPTRVAVIRGRVLDKANTPLPGVAVSVVGRPELGQTLSRSDGWFDLAVNGGGRLTLRYAMSGYLPAQRQANAPWHDYVVLDDAVLVQQDTKVTTVDLADSTQSFQVAQGNAVTDQDGTRQATLLVPRGAQAQVYEADGTKRTVTTLNLRITEYTAGANGAASMPAALPPTSAYTYAIEMRADEATVKREGKDVLFDRLVPLYVDNFLSLPVGTAVPVAYYDQDRSAWVPSDDGRIIKILSVTNSIAEIDIDGDGVADDAANLAALGIDALERVRLASLYAAGQTLWRVQVGHLSTWDLNWGRTLPDDAKAPSVGPAEHDKREPKPNCWQGSIIECENQVLRESLPITGSRLSLNYASNRVEGRKARNVVTIPLSGAQLPASLKQIVLQVDVAGRSFRQSFGPLPNQVHTFTWDGTDAYGRKVVGSAPAKIRIGYVYPAVYASPARVTAASFAIATGVPIEGNRSRNEIVMWQEQTVRLGALDAMAQSTAGWTLSVHHHYDPIDKALYLGTGEILSAEATSYGVISTVAGAGAQGAGDSGQLGDGGPATAARLANPSGLAFASDGSLYIADPALNRIRRVGPDGIISTFAGSGAAGFTGDGGPAQAATFRSPTSVALGPDGSLYIADQANHRIRRVSPDGVISTVAGTTAAGSGGDGGLATAAGLRNPAGVAIGPDGSLYIADQGNHRIRRVGLDGRILTVAGNGVGTFGGDDGPARSASLNAPRGVTLDAEGNLYIADFENRRVRRVGADGRITTIAGNGTSNAFGGDGGPAPAASVSPYDVAIGADGSLYIADYAYRRVRRVGPDGLISTLAGNGNNGFSGDHGPAADAAVGQPRALALSPNGSLHIAADGTFRVRQVSPVLPGFAYGDSAIASPDGMAIYRFNRSGRHLQTLNALTGAVWYDFAYDAAGRLTAVTDGNSNVTTIERDAGGVPIAIVAPFGQRTALATDANGYLASVTNPAGEAYRMTYTADGLLTEFKDPRGNASQMTYDPLGRLERDADAAGGSQTFARTDADRIFTVKQTTGQGRSLSYMVERLATGSQRRVAMAPDGTTTETVIGTDGTRKTTYADGTVISMADGSDPRFSMQAPIAKSLTIATGGLTANLAIARVATLADPNNPLSLTTLTDTVTRNGRVSTSVYDASSRTVTFTSAAGRTATMTTNDLGRPTGLQIAGLAPVSFVYDANGRLSAVTAGSGNDTRSMSFGYNAVGYLETATDSLVRTSRYEYDLAGRVTKALTPDQRQILFGYDAAGNLTTLTPPGRPAHGSSYNPVNDATTYEPPPLPNAGNTRYDYDADRAPTHITQPDGGMLDFAYDNAGRLSSLTLPAGQGGVTLAYHPTTGKLITLAGPAGGTLSYAYTGALLSRSTWAGPVAGDVGQSYDNDFRLASLDVNGADPVAYTYDLDGRMTGAGALTLSRRPDNGHLSGTTLGGVTDARTYNAFGEIESYVARVNGTDVFVVQYTRDSLGRIVTKAETVEGVAHVFAYAYDSAGRLGEVKKDGTVVATYTYDANGNRVDGPGLAIAPTYDAQDRLVSYGTTTYGHSAAGELTSKTVGAEVTSYRYDPLGSLLQAGLPDGTQIDYVVDGWGRRTGRQLNGTLSQGFLYQDSLKPIAELDGTNNVVSRFVYATRVNVPDYMVKGGVTYRIVTDHLGSPRLVVSVADGSIAQRMEYDEWGNVILDDNPRFQPFGFAGGLYDHDTKLARYGARDYDAQTGRWVAKDAIRFIGGSTNLYEYGANDPINYGDPFGLAYKISGVDKDFERQVQEALQEISRTAPKDSATAIDQLLKSSTFIHIQQTKAPLDCLDMSGGTCAHRLVGSRYPDCGSLGVHRNKGDVQWDLLVDLDKLRRNKVPLHVGLYHELAGHIIENTLDDEEIARERTLQYYPELPAAFRPRRP